MVTILVSQIVLGSLFLTSMRLWNLLTGFTLLDRWFVIIFANSATLKCQTFLSVCVGRSSQWRYLRIHYLRQPLGRRTSLVSNVIYMTSRSLRDLYDVTRYRTVRASTADVKQKGCSTLDWCLSCRDPLQIVFKEIQYLVRSDSD